MKEWSELTATEKAAIKVACESSFLLFVQFMFYYTNRAGGKFQLNWHHTYLIKILEDIITGKTKAESVVINVPPGAGKSELYTVMGNVWSIIKLKKLRMMNLSFSKSLMDGFSENAKGVIKHEVFQELWPIGFKKDATEKWVISNSDGSDRAEMNYRSLGGQVTGGRGGYMIPGYSGSVLMDDPSKPDDMFSKVKRTRAHTLMVDTIRSRRALKTDDNPTPFIFIQQRLHHDDLTGFVMRGGLGKSIKIKHIVIPALIDQDYIDSLPKWIRQQCIDDICHTQQIDGYWSFNPKNESINDLMSNWEANEYSFMSQYMQRPIRLGGNLFKSDWWQYYGKIEYHMDEDGVSHREEIGPDLPHPVTFEYRFVTGDTASKTAEINDYSVFCHWGVYDGRVYLIDMFRDKLEFSELRQAMLDFVNHAYSYKDRMPGHSGNLRDVLIEDKSSATSLIQDAQNEMPVAITPVQRNRDKFTRARDVLDPIKRGKVVLPYGDRISTAFVTEHSEFSLDDTHKHDDIVDNCIDAVNHAILETGGIGNAMDMLDDFYS